jgi:hypothetical protein
VKAADHQYIQTEDARGIKPNDGNPPTLPRAFSGWEQAVVMEFSTQRFNERR